MKKVLLCLTAVIATTFSHAQVQFGAKAGLNFATINGADASADDLSKSTLVSLHFGGLVSIPVSESFSVQPELLYSGQGTGIKQDGISGSFTLGYINVPVLAKYTFTNGFGIEAGPQVGFLLSAKEKANGISVDEKQYYKSVDFALAFGLSYKLPSNNIGFDARYNLGLSGIAKAQDGETPKVYNRVIQVGVFYMFGENSND